MVKKLLQYGISSVIGALIALWVMSAEQLFVITGAPSHTVSILCDAFFVPGILFTLFGAMLWISTTGFFDGLGYALRTAAHMFIPFRKTERKTYYDYKVERAEKRPGVPMFLLHVGLIYLALSGVFLVIFYCI